MTDYYLSFADEAEANLMLEGYEGSVDIIGVIYVPDGTFNPDGKPNMKPLDGWHINLRGEENTAFDPYIVEITVPYRTWA